MTFPLLDEVICNIFDSLGVFDLIRCERVCQKFADTIKSSSHLQYRIELYVAGCIDNPLSTLAAHDKLALLLERVRYRKKLNWGRTSLYHLKISGDRIGWKTCRGFMIRFAGDPEPRFELLDLTDCHPTLLSMDLLNPSLRATILTSRFFADPSRDILFIIREEESAHYLDLLLLPDGIPFPDCQNSSILLGNVSFSNVFNLFHVKNELISIIDGRGSAHIILIFNWQTGKMIHRLEADPFIAGSFRIIDSQYFVMTALCSSDPTVESELYIHIGAFGQERPVALYGLPELYDDWHIERVVCYSYDGSAMGRGTFIPYKRPFGPSCEDGLFVFHFKIRSLRPSTRRFTVAIEPGMALSFAKNARYCPVIPWNIWGPKHSRCFLDLDMESTGEHFDEENVFAKVYHHRLMTSSDILDFNQLDIARDLSRGHTDGIIHETSSIPCPANEGSDLGIFTEAVVSHLPYRKLPHRIQPVQRNENLFFSRFHMPEDHLITQTVTHDLDWNIEIYH